MKQLFSIRLQAQARLAVGTQPLPLQEVPANEGSQHPDPPLQRSLSPSHLELWAWLNDVTASVQENEGIRSNGSRDHQCLEKQEEGAKREEKEQGRDALLDFTPDLAVEPKSWLGHQES